ncbi:MAG TPA: pYEATS domain-containing protein [Steroidobacteraceae bacterium]|nr:pYEATS domain-containing protein [Steroidobacteraceae bacterium]
MTITTQQSATYSGKDWWDWAVWIEAPKKEMDAIKQVVYTLHATFADPVRVIKTRRNGFRLESAGWGEFDIYIEIERTDGKKLDRVHSLKLEYPRETVSRSAAPPGPRAPPKSAAVKSAAVKRAPVKRAISRGPSPAAETRGESERQPTVYVSSGAADADFARLLKEQLAKRGVNITRFDDAAMGQPWESCVKEAIRKSDAAVFIVSGQPSLWSSLEMDYAKGAAGKQVIPLLVGTAAKLPDSLADRQALHVDSSKDVNVAMEQILKATKVSA